MKKKLSLLIVFTVLAVNSYAAQVIVIPLNTTKLINAEGVTYSCNVSLAEFVGGAPCIFPTIPAGKNFVAEFIGGYALVPSGQEMSAKLLLSSVGGQQSLFIRKQMSQSVLDEFIISQSITYYLAEGQSLSIQLGRNSSTGTGSGSFYLTGYLVPSN